MKEINGKGLNEIFLCEISKFDSRKYAYDLFFNCDSERFKKISRFYSKEYGNGAYNYMVNTFLSWKGGIVNPNGSSTFNIVASATSSFTDEEKFVEAYAQLAKHIKNGFPNRISLKEVNSTFIKVVEKIETFNLEKTTPYSKYIYNESEMSEYQLYVKNAFKFYTKTIFENLNKDIELLLKFHKKVNTSYLKTSYTTYLYNIRIATDNIVNNNFVIKKDFEIEYSILYENLLNDKIANLSFEKLFQIAKINGTTKIDGFLTKSEIDKIVSRKLEFENSKKKGTITMNLKTNSGILKINLRILSPYEKAIIILRFIGFKVAVSILAYYCLIKTSSFFIFTGGLFVLSFLVIPIYNDLINLTKDFFKSKTN